MHRLHSGFTLAAPLMDGRAPVIRKLLKELNDGAGKGLQTFSKSDTTLFVSGVILPRQLYFENTHPKCLKKDLPQDLPETLLIATTYCGPLKLHLLDLIKTSKRELCEVLRHCRGFPREEQVDDKTLISYFNANSYKSAFNSRYNCITKIEVAKEKKLKSEIEDYLDKAQSFNAFNGLSALQVKTLIQRHIGSRGDEYEWCKKASKKTVTEILLINRGPITTTIFSIAIITFLIRRPKFIPLFISLSLGAFVALLATVKQITKYPTETAARPLDKHVQETSATQSRPVINEMTAVAPLKRGRLRRYFYAAALKVVGFFAPFLMKIPTVSNLRWLVIDNKKRLVFLSNFSNTTDAYVRDFLNGDTPRGVNFMFTNGTGFPDARLLLFDGITKNPEGYMNAVRTGQEVTDLRYVHEPDLTAEMINRNRRIRNGLFKQMNEKEANDWLKLL